MINDLKVYASDRILKCHKVILIPHNNPDFDAIGSAAGLTLIAKKYKKESKIIKLTYSIKTKTKKPQKLRFLKK